MPGAGGMSGNPGRQARPALLDLVVRLIVSHRWGFDSGQGPTGRDEIFPVPTCLSALYLTTVARSDGNGGR